MEIDPTTADASPQAVAERVTNVMLARDFASRGLGIEIEDVAPGCARLAMTVRLNMLNGHAICHGGFIFTLADSAFAYACNSRNDNTVASGCAIDYLAPAQLGARLIAEAKEQSLSGRTGVYDVTVTDQDGRRIALFRGRSYRIKGAVANGVPKSSGADAAADASQRNST